jgi:flagellar motor switch protein FliN/FliY
MSMTQSEIGAMLATQWVAAFKEVLTTMTAQEHPVTSEAPGVPEALEATDEPWAWWSQELNVLPGPAMWIGASNKTWNDFGGAVLAALGVEDADSHDSQSTLRDVVTQSTSALVQQLTKQFGTEISCRDLAPADKPSGIPIVVSVSGFAKFDTLDLTIVFNAALFEEIAKISFSSDARSGTPTRPPTGPASEPTRALPKAIADLHLHLHVALGRTTLPLNSVLKLNVGSIIDLSRSLTDLVEVVVNGRIIASGQVVVCNGNYAVQIVSPELNETR